MRSPALAIAWETWARNRWGLTAVGIGWLALAVFCQTPLAQHHADPVGGTAGVFFFLVFIYLLSIFIYSESGSGGKNASFPPRLFTLPIRTSLLVAWPMLYGVLVMTLFWILTGWLILQPCGLIGQVQWWPGLLYAASLALFQAIAWTVSGSPWIRLIVAFLLVPILVLSIVIANQIYHWNEGQTCLLLAGIIGLAYGVSLTGVTFQRRGQSLGGPWLRQMLEEGIHRLQHRRRPFRGPAQAQVWFEWRRKGLLLPMIQAGLQLFLIATLFLLVDRLDATDYLRGLIAIVSLPIVLGFFVGFGMGKENFWAKDIRLSPFLATRPLTSSSLVAAKFRMAARSSLTTAAVILLLTPIWTVLSGNAEVASQGWNLFRQQVGLAKVCSIVPLSMLSFLALTWMQLVAGLTLSLTGRVWLVNGITLLYLAVAGILAALGIWTGFHPDFYDNLLTVLWWLAGLALAVKLMTAGGSWWLMHRQGLLHAATPWGILGIWLLSAGCVVAVVQLLLSDLPRIPVHLIQLGLVLGLPLTRSTAAPLALHWNRHG